LLAAVEKVDSILHVYGHVHEQFGRADDEGDSFNVSLTDTDYEMRAHPEQISFRSP